MNIYKTKDGTYINMEQVKRINVETDNVHYCVVYIMFSANDSITLKDNSARAFLEYLDKHLMGVYAGSA